MKSFTRDELKRRLPALMKRSESIQARYGDLRTAEMHGIVLSQEQRTSLDEFGAVSDEIVLCLRSLGDDAA